MLKALIPEIVARTFQDHIYPPADWIGGQATAAVIVKRQLASIIQDSSFHVYGKDDQVDISPILYICLCFLNICYCLSRGGPITWLILRSLSLYMLCTTKDLNVWPDYSLMNFLNESRTRL